MSSSAKAPIAVGVDGAAATRGAVRYAALEAAAIDAPLLLVHVVPMLLSESAYAPVDRDALLAQGRKLLSESADIARAAAPGVRVCTDLHHGARKAELASAARGAAMIVIGGTHPGAIDRIRTDSMAIALAKHAPCPVVVVPADWRPGLDGPVLVGYESPDSSFDALANGFDLAARTRRGLTILHAWRLPSRSDDVMAARVCGEEIAQHAKETIEVLITGLRQAHPEVPVQIQLWHGQAAHALVKASQHAAALVLARPSTNRLLPHLGSTGRVVLRHARCPIVFGESRPPLAATELVLESGGHRQR